MNLFPVDDKFIDGDEQITQLERHPIIPEINPLQMVIMYPRVMKTKMKKFHNVHFKCIYIINNIISK
jgi:hypothetical protein